ncbi:MAG: outer membrane beta-barrel protein [Bacteroidota bacterium]
MKNLKFPLLLLLVLSFSGLSAQFQFGIKAGLATSSLEGEQLRLTGEGLEDIMLALEEADYGIQAGIFMRLFLGDKLFLQPEFTFNTMEANFRLDDPDQDEAFIFSERYNNIDVPLLIGYKLGPLNLQAGPVGHFFFENTSDIITQEGWDQAFETFNIGYALGGALDIGPLTIDVRYDGNFSKFGQTFTFAGNEVAIDQTPKRWIATVGYRF